MAHLPCFSPPVLAWVGTRLLRVEVRGQGQACSLRTWARGSCRFWSLLSEGREETDRGHKGDAEAASQHPHTWLWPRIWLQMLTRGTHSQTAGRQGIGVTLSTGSWKCKGLCPHFESGPLWLVSEMAAASSFLWRVGLAWSRYPHSWATTSPTRAVGHGPVAEACLAWKLGGRCRREIALGF